MLIEPRDLIRAFLVVVRDLCVYKNVQMGLRKATPYRVWAVKTARQGIEAVLDGFNLETILVWAVQTASDTAPSSPPWAKMPSTKREVRWGKIFAQDLWEALSKGYLMEWWAPQELRRQGIEIDVDAQILARLAVGNLRVVDEYLYVAREDAKRGSDSCDRYLFVLDRLAGRMEAELAAQATAPAEETPVEE